jgi:hypothetical protein
MNGYSHGKHTTKDNMLSDINTRKGTWKHRCFIKGKPHQNGLKWYLLADYDTYIFDGWLYQGQEQEGGQAMATLVGDFAHVLKEEWKHRIACDCLFSGLATAKRLHQEKQYFILCCRADRPSALW